MGSAARKFAMGAAIALFALVSAGHTAGRYRQYQFSIVRGSIASVLHQFAGQTRLQVGTQLNVNESDTDELGPFAGYATAEEALAELLKDSDLLYTWQDEKTIRVSRDTRTDYYKLSSEHLPLLKSIDLPAAPARQQAAALRRLFGYRTNAGEFGDLILGPLRGDFEGRDAWIKMIEPYCRVIVRKFRFSNVELITDEHGFGKTEYELNIGRVTRREAVNQLFFAHRIPIFYSLGHDPSFSEANENELVGPVVGRMPINDAAKLIIEGAELIAHWVHVEGDDRPTLNISPDHRVERYADMSVCPGNFGFKELWPVKGEEVTVEGSRLPTLAEQVDSPVFVGDRKWIDSTGATSIPDLFRYIPQFSFLRSSGYRLSGAQFFEGGRGLGPEYTLVLINGRRAFGSAADPMVSAFDLNSIPLPAVERIEISFDQPSPSHGTDAIGGTVNIVLKQRLDSISADALLGSAEGGATQRRGSLSGGYDWGRIHAGVVIDYFDIDELLGAERERWRDQDFTRYGSTDQRSRFAAPPNVRAITGNLPGLDTTTAAIVPGGANVGVSAVSENRTSLRSFQAIVPASERAGLYGFVSADIGSNSLFRAEGVLSRRRIQYELMPTLIPGFVWGANHPENPFDQDVLIETALTGFPIQAYETESDLTRGAAEYTGSLGSWDYSIFGLAQREHSQRWLRNAMDPLAIMRSLIASDDGALHVATPRPGEGVDVPEFMAPSKTDDFTSAGEQFGASFSGPLATFATSEITADLGIEHRQETVVFDPNVGPLSRNVTSAFARLRLPTIVKNVDLSLGARRDWYSDLGNVTRSTSGINWQLTPRLSVKASIANSFRPPALHELYRPRVANPTQIYDPLRDELVPVTIVFGGNKGLRPTGGRSSSLSMTWQSASQWRASVGLWQIEMRDRLSAPSAPVLLITDGRLADERVVRDPPTQQDRDNGQPGKLDFIDVSYANFGQARISGLDISIERQSDTRIGSIGARLDLTHMFSFDYSELPTDDAPLQEKAGRAALEGTVPIDRAVLSLHYSRGLWQGTLFAKYYSPVDDYSVADGTPTGREISGQTLIDAVLTRSFAKKVDVTLGVTNLLDHQPPFAEGFGDLGYDLSQGDLTGRVTYIKLRASF